MTLPPALHDALYNMCAYAGAAALLTAEQLLILLGPPLLLALAMHLVSGAIRARSEELFGSPLLIWLTAPGTAIHELGHALFCLLFGHKIKEVALFRPRADGVLGYVRHSWDRRSPFQNAGNFFIGTGPIWLGTATILLLCYALLGPRLLVPLRPLPLDLASVTTVDGGLRLLGDAWRTLGELLALFIASGINRQWHFWPFLYLLFCVGSHVTLSASDLDGARSGFGVIVLLLLAFNLATLWLGSFSLRASLELARYATVGNLLLAFALLLNTLVAALLTLAATLRRPG